MKIVINMKKVTAYINTIRVHWLVEELESIGVKEMMVTEYFSPSSRISRMELLTQDNTVEKVREIIHRVGTTGAEADHSLFIEEYDPSLPSQIPFGKRTSKLEETHVKQLIDFLLRGSRNKIRTAFLLITLSIVGVASFIVYLTRDIQLLATETSDNIHSLTKMSDAVENALLEEMLAVERFHRGEPAAARKDFANARAKLTSSISYLQGANIAPQKAVLALLDIEHRFHLIADKMFDMADSLSKKKMVTQKQKTMELSHNHIMSSLDKLRSLLVLQLASFESMMKENTAQRQKEIEVSTQRIKLSLLMLITAAIILTATMWIMIERNVSRPIQRLVKEAQTIDTTELR
ncbi:MAG: hypothetical protein AB1600_04270 [Bacteroidota bacterium]